MTRPFASFPFSCPPHTNEINLIKCLTNEQFYTHFCSFSRTTRFLTLPCHKKPLPYIAWGGKIWYIHTSGEKHLSFLGGRSNEAPQSYHLKKNSG